VEYQIAAGYSRFPCRLRLIYEFVRPIFISTSRSTAVPDLWTLASMHLTPFESEILESMLWQVEGFKIGRVTKRATTRILRATIRRIRPRLIARSEAAEADNREVDHAIPLQVICSHILSTPDLDRCKLEAILHAWLVTVELTSLEHREVLQKFGLASCMPQDWDNADPLARYKVAGIRFREIHDENGG
jgi:hypothetical protein